MLEIFRKTNSKEVVIAIISFFSNLIANITKTDNINYLLSHPCLISLENIKFFSLDNEIAEYYINFLHTISQRIDPKTLYIFFNKVLYCLGRDTQTFRCLCRRLVSIITPKA
jgi:hypothetical protein